MPAWQDDRREQHRWRGPVGASLGPAFPHGLLVAHDDANQLPDGSTSPLAIFKLVSLEKIFGAVQLKSLGLLGQVDGDWDPRAPSRPPGYCVPRSWELARVSGESGTDTTTARTPMAREAFPIRVFNRS